MSSEKDVKTLVRDAVAILNNSQEAALHPVGARAPPAYLYLSQVDRFYRRRRTMTSDKENNTDATTGPGPSPRTKLASSTKVLSLRDSDDTLVEANGPESATHDGLDGVVTGGCSTCGSGQHGTVKCDSKEPPSELMMSGALQTAQVTNMAAVWRAQANVTALLRAQESLTGPAQRTGRRNSV